MNDRSRHHVEQIVYEYATELGLGERRTGFACPFCNGGSSRELSFGVSVGEDGRIFYRCWRDRCRKRGVVGGGISPRRAERQTPKGVVLPRVEGMGGSLWDGHLASRYALSTQETDRAGWGVADKSLPKERLVIPICDVDGVQRGVECRWLSTEYGPKCKSLRLQVESRFEVWASVYRGMGVPEYEKFPVLVVEDNISALKASRYYQVYCLLGTDFSEAKVYEVSELARGRRILLALDRDATQTAATYVNRYGLICPNLKLLPIDRDLKYWSDEELLEIKNV